MIARACTAVPFRQLGCRSVSLPGAAKRQRSKPDLHFSSAPVPVPPYCHRSTRAINTVKTINPNII